MNRLFNKVKDYLLFTPKEQGDDFYLNSQQDNTEYDVREEKIETTENDKVFKNIEENLSYVKDRFTYPINNDIVIREITMKEGRRAFIVFIDGMVNTDMVDLAVIKTLLEIPYISDDELYKYESEIIDKFIAHSQANTTESMDTVFEEINFGSCVVFVDGFSKGFVVDVREWGHRSIDKPENEQSIYGPQEAFAEMLRNNTALVRKIIKSEKLIAEGIKIGKKSKTRGVMLYISDIANPDLVNEVRRRLNGINMDYVISIEEISMMMEEETFSLTTHFLETERPDRVARALTEGRVALILNGSPHVLIMPTNIFELTHAVSDDYLRIPYANMVRIIRMIAIIFSVLLPGLYLAITLFHQEIIPTYLLYSISAARENVPFPSILELLLMDLSFEMIREAGLRMPGPIGSTLGIVGGLILGQAAVSAKIVSPIMIIVIAITGIGSFATADYSLSWSLRILRLMFIALASLMGFYGIAIGIFIYSLALGTQKSFGVPVLEPTPKIKSRSMINSVFVNPIWRREKRPGFLYTKNDNEEPKISRSWKNKKKY
ncbi:MAG: spore germination protein [Clostridia bacterium]|nr:spore germination protein [Clostridia bacterium]